MRLAHPPCRNSEVLTQPIYYCDAGGTSWGNLLEYPGITFVPLAVLFRVNLAGSLECILEAVG